MTTEEILAAVKAGDEFVLRLISPPRNLDNPVKEIKITKQTIEFYSGVQD